MNMIELTKYKTLVFDCDGVVLKSNKIKTQAFYEATKHFGHQFAQAIVDYHIQNGGVSRYIKAKYFITDILQQEFDEIVYQDILNRFVKSVKDGLMSCEVAQGLEELRLKTQKANWLIVSGGDQDELQEVFIKRGLDQYFDGGIFGSPDDKTDILAREIKKGNISSSSLFIGDSKYDFLAASKAGCDFIFLSGWTEFVNWKKFFEDKKVNSFVNISSLLEIKG